ncbi:hypothetical protein ACTNCH_02550 [Candidatus Merdisoma sp. HCP28S3_D10]|uniref:hypothetical protein n=1 Tax=unclassified Candidatus Merdisoma TaxID=3099611 RepID=UPI003F89BF40
MRVINSARELAKRRKEKLIILWYLNPELNCTFEDLFLPLHEPDITLINIRSLKDPRKLYYQLSASQRFGNEDILNNKTDGTLNDAFYQTLKKRVYIFTWEHFYPSKDYSLYAPTAALRERIDAFTKDFAPRCVGVHIRRTDNAVSMGKSTTDQFIALMEQELLTHPETRFFLATDDQSEEDLLRSRFPGKIISNQSRTIDRNSVAGMHDALLDLYCLAASDKIIGSYWSSFTDTAADMRGIEKVIAGE